LKYLGQEFVSYRFSSYQFIVHFHQAVLDNNLAEITVAYESGWNKFTEKFYSRTEWPEAELIAPLVNDGTQTNSIMESSTGPSFCRPHLLDSLSRALLPSCLLPPATQYRRSFPLLRKQLRVVQLLAQCVDTYLGCYVCLTFLRF